MNAVITGTGSFIPTKVVRNVDFLKNEFYDEHGKRIEKSNEEIIQKFEQITGITERRYVTDDQLTSDIAYMASRDALESAQVDPEELDLIIVAHNFGDIKADNKKTDLIPSLATRVKHHLQIENPDTIAYDLPFGCPGWLQGVIQVNTHIKTGEAVKALVVGAETLSRVSDPHDRDCMIYADGAGAAVIEAKHDKEPMGILSHASRTDAIRHGYMLWMGPSYNPGYQGSEIFLKMDGHKLYEYALKTVPAVVKKAMDKAGLSINEVSKVFIHQANEKMDNAILKRLYNKEYGIREIPDFVMPMTISWLGNSSVATLPTLYDLLRKGKLNNHSLKKGDHVVFTSVGAGMNINAVVYRIAEDIKTG
ncbi:MAG: ketoacyl-ACP synthase III [Deltaproteobacteria bacterium]|nr:ketoacyl-ACP synthase III [Deltaproteobacteria bacterium]